MPMTLPDPQAASLLTGRQRLDAIRDVDPEGYIEVLQALLLFIEEHGLTHCSIYRMLQDLYTEHMA